VCGIVGTFNFRSLAPVDERSIERMTRLLAHRGPDAEGLYVDGPVGLGHRRLSILDLSDRGRNPMFTADGRYAIVYNGEVYNFLELRRDLERRGEVFRTDTDTEVLLRLYVRLGPACLDQLNGMFAFAIWDTVERTLFLARDRAGIKPLYYAETPDGVAFASEAKSLFCQDGVPRTVDPSALDACLTFGYTPGERTPFRGVKKLLPGWAMTVSTGGIRQSEYWDVRFDPNESRGVEQTAAELRELLTDAVKIQMRSDVPVGVFLSGGLDSSATVALLAASGFDRVKTFSVAYRGGGRYDETRYARLVAEHFGTVHEVLYLDEARFGAFIPDYVWYMDEPVAEAAGISLFFIAQLLRQHVTVALSGEGSDELFGGYQIYRYMSWLERYRRMPRWCRERIVAPLLARIGSRKLTKYMRLGARPLENRYTGVNQFDSLAPLYSSDLERATSMAPEASLAELFARAPDSDALAQMLYVDFKSWLPDDLLIKADRMTMANAVELRVPFLDHRVVEYAATIPSGMKQCRGTVKWILKRALRGRLPRAILTRSKVGFPTPLARMFRGPLADYVQDLLLSRRCLERGYFERSAIETVLQAHRAGAVDHHDTLWRLIVLEEWHRRFIDAPRSVWATSDLTRAQPVTP